MPLDLSGFVSPENKFEGLQQVAATTERHAERQQQLALQQEAKKNASATFLTNVLDPKQYLSGSLEDPNITAGLNQIMQQGMGLAAKGIDNASLYQALSPALNKLAMYSNNAKLTSQNIKDQVAKLSKFPGYDPDALEEEAKNRAFFDIDPKTGVKTLKDPSKIDPNNNWIAQTVNEAGDKVTTDAGIEAFAKNSPKSTRTDDILTTAPNGTKTHHKVDITAANWEVPEVGANGQTQMVPKYQIATDGGKPITHEFTNADGTKTSAPVRVFDEQEFDKFVSSNPSIIHRINGLVAQHIKEYKDANGNPIDLGSPQAKIVAQAMAYDLLKSQGSSTIKNVQSQTLAPAQVHVNLYGGAEQEASNKEAGKREGDVKVLGNQEMQSFNKAAGTRLGQQAVSGNDSTRAAERAKGIAAGKAAAAGGTGTTDPIARFSTNGDIKSLAPLEGTTLKDGTKVTKVNKLGFGHWNNYSLDVEKDGKEQIVKFNNKADLAAYLKDNATHATAAPAAVDINALRSKYKY